MTRGLVVLSKTAAIVLAAGALYLLAEREHAERERLRTAAVELTPSCQAKLEAYQPASGASATP